MAELWRKIPGFSGYEVSSFGRVRSLRCGGRFGDNLRRGRPRLLVGITSHDGYQRVGIRNDSGRRRMIYVHQLVLFAFVGPRPDGCEASHINGDKQDNRPENLCWETKSDNNSRKGTHGTQPRYMGSANPAAKLTNAQRIEIARRYRAGGISQRELGKQFDIAQSSVGDIVRSVTLAQGAPA